jgi:hypothetical protein
MPLAWFRVLLLLPTVRHDENLVRPGYVRTNGPLHLRQRRDLGPLWAKHLGNILQNVTEHEYT